MQEEEIDVEYVDELLNVEANGEKEKEKDESKVKTNDKRIYCCDECGVLSKNLANLKKHMLTHSGERPFKCSTCPKAFRQQHHLVDHQRTHTGERPFRCDECGASYVQKSSLNVHKKKHTGIKPYICKICGYSAYEKIHLKIHMRTHTGEKPYQCEKCGQTFSTSTRLNFHRMIHTGEKRYKCEECGVRFREKVTLEQHRGVHVNLGPFVCSECGQEFSKLAGLSLHRKVHTHKDDYLYVYNKEANEAFKSATFSKSKESSEVQKQREETTDKLTNDNEHAVSSTNETENVSEIQYNIPRSEEMTDCSLPDKSPQKTQLVNASDLKLQDVKETLVSSLKNHAVDCFSSDVNPDQVRAALESGKIVKTEDGEGKGFFIVLPPALRNEEIMFMSESTQCKSNLLADSHQVSNPVLDHDISSKFCTHNLSFIKEKTQVADSEEELQGSDLCIEVHEEVSEEPSSFSVGINEELQDINALKMKRDIVGNVGRYSQVKKEIHPDGSSLLLWNDELEPLEEVTYIIDEGTENPLTIHSQEVLDTPNLKPKKRKAKSDDKRKQKKALLEPGKSTRKTKEKNKMPKEKKVKIPRIYDCIQCGKACRTSSNYISHMRTHSGERPYFCDICGMGFKQIAHLRSHIRTHTGERPYVCDICNAAFTQSSRLKSHKKSRHTNTELKKVKKHVSEQKVRNFYCKICKKTFINECYKREHMRSHIQPKDFKCKICDVRYKTKISLVKHTLTHSDHQVVCEMCGLGFPNLTALHNHRFNEHNKSVTDSGVSDMCINVKIGEEQDFVVINPSIKDSSNVEGDDIGAMKKVVTFEEVSDGHAKHKVLQLTEEDGQMRSQVLLETPASEVQIKLEEKTDADVLGAPSGDRNNKVDVDYNGMDDIKQDEDDSDKEVDENHTFHCSELLEREKVKRENKNMWFTYINNEGKKIWQCEVCNRLFLQSSNLHCHLRMHTGERPYKCNVCSRAFRQITHLKDHMSRHTGIRPHQCSACGSLFSQRSAATRHIKLAHQGVKDAVVIRNTQPQVNGKNKSRSKKTISRKCSKADVNNTCSCKSCSHSYSSSSIKSHIQCPTGGRTYSCIKCKASFKQKGHLMTHMVSHSKWKLPFVCSCGKKYKSHKILSDHKRRCSETQETTDQVLKDCGCEDDSCSGCPISKHKQNGNILVTDNDSDQSTDVSDYISFDDESDEEIIIPRKKNTNLHKNINKFVKMEASKENGNNEKKKYICPKCKEVVVEFTTYKNHILGHGNHLKEVCEICGEVFRRASTLKFHQNVKHGRKDERYMEFNTFAEDRGKNEDEHYTDFELKLSDNERDEGVIKESILNDSDKNDNLKLRSLTRSKNKIKGNSEKANTKMLPVCTMDTLHSDKTNSSVKKLSCKSKMKSKRVSTFKGFNAKKKECQDNLEKGTSNCKALDTATEGKYTCEACNMVFTRHSKLRYHMAMWCKKQEKSAEAVNENISENSQSPNRSSLQVIVREVSLKRGKNSDRVLLEGSLSCSKNIYVDNHVKSCNESGDASKTGGTEGTKYHESGEELPQIETLLVKEENQPSDSVKLKTKDNAFYCNICRKHFCKVNSYKVHMATHLNERPFKCDRCLQTFNQKAHLTSHYRRHTGERPYKCPHCFQAFTQPHNLKKHRKKCN